MKEEKELSPEEYEAKKKEMTEYYEKELPMLKLRLEYEGTIASLEEARARYLRAQQIIANIKAGPPEDNPQERKLRKE